MSDQQKLIDRTAAAIADEMFQVNGIRLWSKDKFLTTLGCWTKAEFKRLVAKHLQRMLAERDEKGLFDET